MNIENYQFFQKHGYLSLGKIFNDREVAKFLAYYEYDRAAYPDYWYSFGHHQTINCDALASTPEFDLLIRHPKVMEPLLALMGGPICFSEICLRHMGPYEGNFNQGWHRDRSHWKEHPLRLDYIQLMVYLSQVDETTHCFSISPEGIDEQIVETKEQLDRAGGYDLYGPAGTAILFNVSVLHTATTRVTPLERKTVQVYYGHRSRPFLSNDSVMPPALSVNHEDPEIRSFYGVWNDKTRTYLERMKSAVPTNSNIELNIEEIGRILKKIDIENGKRR